MTAVGGICLLLSFFLSRSGISKISSALLISIAMLAAIAVGDLFAAGEAAFIMALGALLKEKTTNRAQQGLHSLIRLKPTQGRRLDGEGPVLIPAVIFFR